MQTKPPFWVQFDFYISKVRAVMPVLAFGCLCFVLIECGLALKSVKDSSSQLSFFLAQTNKNLYEKGGLMDKINATALHADKLVGEASHAAQQAAQVSIDQKNFLKEEDARILETTYQVRRLVDNLQGSKDTITKLNLFLDDLHKTAGDLDGVVIALRKDVEDADPLLQATTKAITDVDANLLNDPDIKEAMHNVEEILKHGNGIAINAEKMSADAEAKFHALLTGKPSMKSRIIGYLQIAYYLALIKATLGVKVF